MASFELYRENRDNVTALDLRVLGELPQEILSMTGDSVVASIPNMLGYLLPVLPIFANSLKEPQMLIFVPSASCLLILGLLDFLRNLSTAGLNGILGFPLCFDISLALLFGFVILVNLLILDAEFHLG